MKKMMIRALTLGTAAAFCITAGAAAQGSLSVGDKAPEFPNPLPSSAGEKPGAVKIQLADYLGKKNIVLAFYVADWTGG
jgi:peroxiredoxin Q/BCP